MANFKHEDFHYDSLNELKTFLELWKERFPDSWINDVKMFTKDSKGVVEFTFKNWNDIKISHYDCDDADFVFFRCLAKYLEGNVAFVNGNDIDKIQITISFRGGKAYFERGRMEYTNKPINSRTMKYKNNDKFKEMEAIVSMVKEKKGGLK